MTIIESIEFELKHNFNVSLNEAAQVVEVALIKFDLNETAESSPYFNAGVWVDETLCEVL